MIMGPVHTPYEDGLFAFDVQLPANFPTSPPVFHYHSFCNERLNPNLYEDGKVCVSLLGTWSGKGNELWTTRSSVLQVLVSIQGLILVPEPYFNEAGYEKQRGSQHGQENSRMYNEMAVLKLVQSMTKMAVTPPAIFVEETRSHLHNHAYRMIERIEKWVEFSNKSRLHAHSVGEASHSLCNGDLETATDPVESGGPGSSESTDTNCQEQPKNREETKIESRVEEKSTCLETNNSGFPLLPASKGFCITIKKHLECFKEVLSEHVFNSAA